MPLLWIIVLILVILAIGGSLVVNNLIWLLLVVALLVAIFALMSGRRVQLRIGLVGIIYLVIGLIVAATHHYFAHIQTAKAVLSAVLAVALWPLILLGINLHIH